MSKKAFWLFILASAFFSLAYASSAHSQPLGQTSSLDASSIILWIVSIGIIVGGLDHVLGNRLGLGAEFENGLKTLGPLALVVIGVISIAPVVAKLIQPVASPILQSVGADPSMIASIIALDMGGYPLANALALSPSSAAFSGLIVASMLGATLVFTMPLALVMIKEKDRIFFLKGLLAGLITIPVGAFLGGFAAGFPLNELVLNTIPIVIVSLALVLALAAFPRKVMLVASCLGKLVMAVAVIGLLAASIEALTGFAVIPGMAPVTDGFKVIGSIAIVLMGAFPLVKLATSLLRKQFGKMGSALKINSQSVAGLIASLVNNIPTLHIFGRMDARGKIINSAFMVSGAFLIGDHLGFVASVNRQMIAYVMLAKIIAAVLSIPIALALARRTGDIKRI